MTRLMPRVIIYHVDSNTSEISMRSLMQRVIINQIDSKYQWQGWLKSHTFYLGSQMLKERLFL